LQAARSPASRASTSALASANSARSALEQGRALPAQRPAVSPRRRAARAPGRSSGALVLEPVAAASTARRRGSAAPRERPRFLGRSRRLGFIVIFRP